MNEAVNAVAVRSPIRKGTEVVAQGFISDVVGWLGNDLDVKSYKIEDKYGGLVFETLELGLDSDKTLSLMLTTRKN